jgi:hypothetical protein
MSATTNNYPWLLDRLAAQANLAAPGGEVKRSGRRHKPRKLAKSVTAE